MKIILFGCLFVFFFLLFWKSRWLQLMSHLYKKTQEGMEGAARQRNLANRQNLQNLQRTHSALSKLEQQLYYSGFKFHFTFLTAENFVVSNLLLTSVLFIIFSVFAESRAAPWIALSVQLILQYLIFMIGRAITMRNVNESLLKFLDFLGNYSITAGEVTGILNQVSKYMKEPLHSVLEECFYEAQTTGDANLALLSMAQKVEHIKFKELAANMEISIRYCADFTVLVRSSRKSLREYLRIREERKSMLLEAMINMLMLLCMSGFVLAAVGNLVGIPTWSLLKDTLPGRITLGITAAIALLFLRKISGLHD